MSNQQKLRHQEFQLNRYVRTTNSEAFFIFWKDINTETRTLVGSFDLHISDKIYYGTLILVIKLKAKELDELIAQINNQLIESPELREDFILSVFQGKEIGYYSDTIDDEQRQREPSTRGDLENISSTLAKVIGRHQDARGKLNEHALCSYFRSLGYDAELTDSKLDQKKVDVVAKGRSEIIYAQAKLGTVSSSEIRAIAKSVASLPFEGFEQKIAAISASVFPKDCEMLRYNLEKEFNLPIWCIQKYQIIQEVPEYRRMLD